jgi:hypothetical protein
MRMVVLVLAVALLAGSASAAIPPEGCDGEWLSEPVTQRFDYANDIQPIWDQFCANCHINHAGSPQAGLDLDPPFSYFNLVDVPDGGLSILLVKPGDPEASLLWRKVNCSVPGPDPEDNRMPLNRVPLTPAAQARIHDWIAAGAPQMLERLFAGGFEAR